MQICEDRGGRGRTCGRRKIGRKEEEEKQEGKGRRWRKDENDGFTKTAFYQIYITKADLVDQFRTDLSSIAPLENVSNLPLIKSV